MSACWPALLSRGINSIQMFYDGTRYWITEWMFDGRSAAPAVEEAYLPESRWGDGLTDQ